MAHTLGEWFYDDRTQSIGYSGGWLASTAGREGEGLGNEHDDGVLMAAVPDLLAACKAFVTAWEQSHQLEKTDIALRLAKAAIEKAEPPAEVAER